MKGLQITARFENDLKVIKILLPFKQTQYRVKKNQKSQQQQVFKHKIIKQIFEFLLK